MNYSETYFNINTYSHGGMVLTIDRSKDSKSQEYIYTIDDFIADTFLSLITTILLHIKSNTKAKLKPISVRLSLAQLLNILQLKEDDFIPIIKPIYESGVGEDESRDKFHANITKLSCEADNQIFKLVEDRIKPDIFEPKNKPAKIIEPRLFNDRNLEPTPSCAIVDTVFTFCVGKTLAWEKLTGELATKKKFANGTVELIIKQVEETILHEYGLDTVKVFYTLMSYSLKHKNSLTEFITVSGWELLSYLNKQSMRDNCKGLKS